MMLDLKKNTLENELDWRLAIKEACPLHINGSCLSCTCKHTLGVR